MRRFELIRRYLIYSQYSCIIFMTLRWLLGAPHEVNLLHGIGVYRDSQVPQAPDRLDLGGVDSGGTGRCRLFTQRSGQSGVPDAGALGDNHDL